MTDTVVIKNPLQIKCINNVEHEIWKDALHRAWKLRLTLRDAYIYANGAVIGYREGQANE